MALLKKGSNGDDVKELQTLLNNNGYKLDTDGIYGDKTAAAVKDYQQKNNLAADGIAGTQTLSKLKGNTASQQTPTVPTQPQTPAAVQQQPQTQTSQTTYADQINSIVQKILNREPVQYDYNGDPMYQMYKDAYIQNGQLASKDALARAAALTGGYGNSYANQVAQQTSQQYVAELNNKIPELEQLARARYDAETGRLTDNLGILTDLENRDYTRAYNEEQRDYERQQYADQLKRQESEDAWNRKYAMAQLAAQYGDASKLKELGINVSNSTVPSNNETDTWAYDQYIAYMDENPPYDDTTAKAWGEKLVEAYLNGRLTENQYFTIIDKYDNVYKAAWDYYEDYLQKLENAKKQAEIERRAKLRKQIASKPTNKKLSALDEYLKNRNK